MGMHDRNNTANHQNNRLTLIARMNLALAELQLILAAIFRRYDCHYGNGEQVPRTLALYDTLRERDVDMHFDMISPISAKDSKGIRVTVR